MVVLFDRKLGCDDRRVECRSTNLHPLANVACHVHAREARERRVVSLTPEETRIIYYGGLPGRGKSYI